MPLSEHEQRLLDQMEQALYSEDPKFASTLRSGGARRVVAPDKRKVVFGLFGLIAGIGLLIAGVVTRIVPIGVVGFLVMLSASYVILTGYRSGHEGQSATAGKSGTKAANKGFMNKMEHRWQTRRQNEQ